MAAMKLMRRDVPIDGRLLEFEYRIVFRVNVDDDFLQGEKHATLEDVERWLGDNSEAIYLELRRNYDYDVVEHVVRLADADYGPALQADIPRFESRWEKTSRERGDEWQFREWVEIPEAAS